MPIRFLLDGEAVELDAADPTGTVLDHLRYTLRRTGTKEGCAEGDCGACTVLVGSLEAGKVVWRAVNACILFLPMLHGRALMTVESLRDTPLQRLMAANGSSQCGFCTPGFVMTLHGRSIGACGSDLPVADVLAGNLCRCTGYGPLLAAGEATPVCEQDDAALVDALNALHDGESAGGDWKGRRWWAPRSKAELAGLLAAHPDARMVAGGTDVGLWITKQLRTLTDLIFLSDVADLAAIEETPEALTLGAAVRYADAHAALARLHPDMGELVRRLGGLQVRNAATVGGNIANGSPIGDGPPALIALGAELTLRSASGRRTVPLEAFFLTYGRQDLRPGEFVEQVRIPRPTPDTLVQITKLSRRFDSDISAVCGAFALRMAGDVVAEARIAFGGMAATPQRATACEAALAGRPLDADTIAAAMVSLATDFQPISDVRGSAAYRQQAAGALLQRLLHRRAAVPVSVLEVEA